MHGYTPGVAVAAIAKASLVLKVSKGESCTWCGCVRLGGRERLARGAPGIRVCQVGHKGGERRQCGPLAQPASGSPLPRSAGVVVTPCQNCRSPRTRSTRVRPLSPLVAQSDLGMF
jgi:hypothetical protein